MRNRLISPRLPRTSGPGGYKQPRLKRTCGENGGRNRFGQPCRCKELFKRAVPVPRGQVDPTARCRFHGGMLAGPKTPEGRLKAAQAGTEALRRYRARLAQSRQATQDPSKARQTSPGTHESGLETTEATGQPLTGAVAPRVHVQA